MNGYIYGINGPILTVKGTGGFVMSETVYAGEARLHGEVIRLTNDSAIIQVFEDASGLRAGETVAGTGELLSVTLGPGIISNIFDGTQRPLIAVEKQSGSFISRGLGIKPLDEDKQWPVKILVNEGDSVRSGEIIATLNETGPVEHKIMADVSGTVLYAAPDGDYRVNDIIVKIENCEGKVRETSLCQRWPVRTPRPYKNKLKNIYPLITGQRIIDTFFPLAKGGMAALPGGFGTGKTITQHQIAKFSDADIIIYIGCGERGNEMTQTLEEFASLIDPRTGRSLLERAVLIANTSNMPVAAREASIYTGITIAEYYRDMGYHVAVMADSTSRWAEALRELSGRLEEIPAEEGFPAYLASRLSAFYERAGRTENLNGTTGSVTIIGAVSPQGGDFSEPVTQNTKRFVRCFWTLDRNLSYARHFPAINWLTSYSEYTDDLEEWYLTEVGESFFDYRTKIMALLQQENELNDIVRLIGADVLPDGQKLILEISGVIHRGFTQQNAFHKYDSYVPLKKQMRMLEVILHLYETAKKLISLNIPMSVIKKDKIFLTVVSMKNDIGNDEPHKFDELKKEIDLFYERVVKND